MSGGALMAITVAMSLLVLVFLIVTMVRSIQAERTEHRSIWREFGLGLALMILFFPRGRGRALPSGRPTPTSRPSTTSPPRSVTSSPSSARRRSRTGSRSSSSCSPSWCSRRCTSTRAAPSPRTATTTSKPPCVGSRSSSGPSPHRPRAAIRTGSCPTSHCRSRTEDEALTCGPRVSFPDRCGEGGDREPCVALLDDGLVRRGGRGDG